ncbi:MAG: PQQ-binding-like beta-propeller repeat protein [Cyanobacteria bacterium]|nr:PQQ-binding-like beta-propeller repeat protein [Cyanobacteriota bacterium]
MTMAFISLFAGLKTKDCFSLLLSALLALSLLGSSMTAFGKSRQKPQTVVSTAWTQASPSILWKVRLPQPIEAQVVWHHQMAVVVGTEGTVYGLNRQTGQLLWETTVGEPLNKITPVWNHQLVIVGTEKGLLVALDAQTGKVNWSKRLSQGTPIRLVGADGYIFAVARNGLVSALDEVSGQQYWQFQTQQAAAIEADPVLTSDALFIADLNGRCYRLSLTDGALEWVYTAQGNIVAAPVIQDQDVYVPTTVGTLYVLNRQDGSLRWSFTSRLGAPLYSSPMVNGNTVWLGDSKGRLTAVKRQDGTELWSVWLDSPILSSPKLDGQTLLVLQSAGVLVGMQADSGQILWKHEMKSVPAGLTAQIEPHQWLFGTRTGWVYSLKMADSVATVPLKQHH